MDIKFTGDFKKLIPMGFKFYKLYANNYKVYEKNKVWIWVAYGGYVEIDDYYENSIHIAKRILDGTYPVHKEDRVYNGFFTTKKGKPKSCVMDMETGEIIEKIVFIRSIGADAEYDYNRYRDIYLYRKTMETIKEIREMIEIEGIENNNLP